MVRHMDLRLIRSFVALFLSSEVFSSRVPTVFVWGQGCWTTNKYIIPDPLWFIPYDSYDYIIHPYTELFVCIWYAKAGYESTRSRAGDLLRWFAYTYTYNLRFRRCVLPGRSIAGGHRNCRGRRTFTHRCVFFSMSPPRVCPTLRDLLFVWHVLPFSNFVYCADPAHIAGEEEGYGDEF